MTAANLDRMTNHRFSLGLGIGHKLVVEKIHGGKFEDPVGRTEETVSIIRQLLTGESFSMDGEHFQINNARLGLAAKDVCVPIYLAALRPKMIGISGNISDGVLLNWTAVSKLKDFIQIFKSANNTASNKLNPDVAGYIRTYVGTKDIDAARIKLKREIAQYSRHPNYRSFFISCGFEKEMLSAESALNSNDIDTAIASISSNMEKEVAMVGSPADCYDQIAKRTTLGLDLPVLAPFGVSNNIKVDYLNTLKAFAQ
jgi:alkanesulfonate monooxygenase SsuD/methylene tetrahydromethanopterin reductase-like flavin-dependent oxidoreductase (luciferase family)